jgi:hypothetical protein
MRLRILLLIVIALASVQCSKKNTAGPNLASVEDLIIKDNEISGWRRVSEGWVAGDYQALYAKIDGGAEIYDKHGFLEGAYQDYSGYVLQDSVTVELKVYDQGKSSNLPELFAELIPRLSSTETWQTDRFQEAKIERLPLLTTIYAWKSKYFVYAAITSNTSEALEVLKTFASNVGSKIK